jgi:putative transposase
LWIAASEVLRVSATWSLPDAADFLPEHIHLLVFLTRSDTTEERISEFLRAVKMPCSQDIKQDLEASGSRLLERLTTRERPGRMAFRFWQEGPGYDRNLQTQATVLAAIDYIHLNPVRSLTSRPIAPSQRK